MGKIPDLTRIDEDERKTELDRATHKVTSNRRWLEHGQSWGQFPQLSQQLLNAFAIAERGKGFA